MSARIYAITSIENPEDAAYLVKANSRAHALRYLTEKTLACRVAPQDLLVEMLTSGAVVEDATAETDIEIHKSADEVDASDDAA